MRVHLRENGESRELHLDLEVALAFAETGFIDVRAVPHSRGRWDLRPLSKVGAVRVGDLEVHVAPKVDIRRIIFMLDYSEKGVKWRDETVTVTSDSDLLTAIAEAFARITERATRHGLLQGYRTRDEALTVIRGRVREADQLRRRFGIPLPIEVRYDDFTVDIAENRLLLAALHRIRRMPGLSADLRRRLTRLDERFADVAPPVRGMSPEPWQPTRLNGRYWDALRLAEVILRASSFEPPATRDEGGLTVTGFVLDMARVFEDFVCRVMAKHLRGVGGRVELQDRWHLDLAHEVSLRPDLVWYPERGNAAAVGSRGVGAVVDAKYKAEKNEAFPNPDVYQLLAYCTALRLPEGHLVYAQGNEVGKHHTITGADIQIHAHAIDLDLEPELLLDQLRGLADQISEGARSPAEVAIWRSWQLTNALLRRRQYETWVVETRHGSGDRLTFMDWDGPVGIVIDRPGGVQVAGRSFPDWIERTQVDVEGLVDEIARHATGPWLPADDAPHSTPGEGAGIIAGLLDSPGARVDCVWNDSPSGSGLRTDLVHAFHNWPTFEREGELGRPPAQNIPTAGWWWVVSFRGEPTALVSLRSGEGYHCDAYWAAGAADMLVLKAGSREWVSIGDLAK